MIRMNFGPPSRQAIVAKAALAATLAFAISIAMPTLAWAQAQSELSGKWKTTQAGASKSFTAAWEFNSGQFTLEMTRSDGRKVSVQGKITVNANTTPKTFNLTGAAATIDSKQVPMPDQLGIYTITPDNYLILRMGAKRPTTLEGLDAQKDPSWMKLNRIDD